VSIVALQLKAWRVHDPYEAFASYAGCVASGKVMSDLYRGNYDGIAFDYYDDEEDLSIIEGVFLYEIGGNKRYLAGMELGNPVYGIGSSYVVYTSTGEIESLGDYSRLLETAARAVLKFLKGRYVQNEEAH